MVSEAKKTHHINPNQLAAGHWQDHHLRRGSQRPVFFAVDFNRDQALIHRKSTMDKREMIGFKWM